MDISESEKKRLYSLKEKKQAFKTKGQLIQQALRNIDNIAKNTKIIFDDDIDKQQSPKLKRKKDLFDSDNDNDNDNNDTKDSLSDQDKFSFEKNTHKMITLGNDSRFTLDDRFVEDNHRKKESRLISNTDECDLQKEKERDLDILESILGTPLKINGQETKTEKKRLGMIRYDPTESGHHEYEIKPEQPEIKRKVKRKKHEKPISEIKEGAPPEPEVSKDIYYSVSDTLTDSLKQKSEFSLLKAYGKEKDDTVNTKDYNGTIAEDKAKRCKFNFNVNDAFKYDSSDDKDICEKLDTNKGMFHKVKDDINNLFGHNDTLFFKNDDVRFNEAIKFFSTQAASNNEFHKLRRELKTIIHKKILRNEKKRQLSGKRRKTRR